VVAGVRRVQEGIDLEFLHAEIPRAFERTLEGVQRVADIVRAMKEFAHPGHVEQSAADLNHAVQTTLTVARNEYKYSAQIETHLGELPDVICNVSELNQVLLNLIVNAAQAVRESGKDATTGRISITTESVPDRVRIRITDNGCGIPQENLEKIFDPFFTTKEVGLGTGQGLAIARSIVVDKHGGEISVESELGVGTSFILSLPIEGRGAPRAAA
jgi:signal transduction histidine kinase